MERSTAGYNQRIQVGMMHSATRIEYHARLVGSQLALGAEFAPSGQPARRVRPLARRRGSKPNSVSQRLRRVPDKNRVHWWVSVLEIDDGKSLFSAFLKLISARFLSLIATLRSVGSLRTTPLLRNCYRFLTHRAPSARGAAAHQLSSTQSQTPAGSSLRFAQIRELALAPQSGGGADAAEIGQQFRAMRHQLALSRRDTALRLGCTEEQILVLENGYGNLAASSELLGRLGRIINAPPDASAG